MKLSERAETAVLGMNGKMTAVLAAGIPAVALGISVANPEASGTAIVTAGVASVVSGIISGTKLVLEERRRKAAEERERIEMRRLSHEPYVEFSIGKDGTLPNLKHVYGSTFVAEAASASRKIFESGVERSSYVHFREPLGSYWYMADRYFEHRARPVSGEKNEVVATHHTFRKLENSEIYRETGLQSAE